MDTHVQVLLRNGEAAISLPAVRKEFTTLQDWLNSISVELALPKKTVRQMMVATDEIFTNIAEYAYQGETGLVDVAVSYDKANGVIGLSFVDSGIAFNPLEEAATPDVTLPLNERAIGGLGLFMVKKMASSLEYLRSDDKNILKVALKIADAN